MINEKQMERLEKESQSCLASLWEQAGFVAVILLKIRNKSTYFLIRKGSFTTPKLPFPKAF